MFYRMFYRNGRVFRVGLSEGLFDILFRESQIPSLKGGSERSCKRSKQDERWRVICHMSPALSS